MKTEIIVLENNELIRNLERVQYETEAHKDLLSWMIGNQYNMSATSYQKYHNEYMELFREYQKLKYEFEKECVRAKMPENVNIISWHLDYDTNKVTIEYDD